MSLMVADSADPTGAVAAADEAAIFAARLAQTQALARGDVDAVAAHWSPDITIRRALGHPVDGADEARQMIAPACEAIARSAAAADAGADTDATHTVYQRTALGVQVSAHWPLAWEEGEWSGHPGSAEQPAVIGGRYAAQWVKREGRWLIRSEVFVALSGSGAGLNAQALP